VARTSELIHILRRTLIEIERLEHLSSPAMQELKRSILGSIAELKHGGIPNQKNHQRRFRTLPTSRIEGTGAGSVWTWVGLDADTKLKQQERAHRYETNSYQCPSVPVAYKSRFREVMTAIGCCCNQACLLKKYPS